MFFFILLENLQIEFYMNHAIQLLNVCIFFKLRILLDIFACSCIHMIWDNLFGEKLLELSIGIIIKDVTKVYNDEKRELMPCKCKLIY